MDQKFESNEIAPAIPALIIFRTVENEPFLPVIIPPVFTSTVVQSPAENMYKNHLKNVSNYQKKNRDKMNEKQKKFISKLKEDKPDQYLLLLEKKKKYYQDVIKPKNEAKKQEKNNLKLI